MRIEDVPYDCLFEEFIRRLASGNSDISVEKLIDLVHEFDHEYARRGQRYGEREAHREVE